MSQRKKLKNHTRRNGDGFIGMVGEADLDDEIPGLLDIVLDDIEADIKCLRVSAKTRCPQPHHRYQ